MPFYASYTELWRSENHLSLAALPFSFLACLASYRAVTSLYAVSASRALVWFLLLPLIVYGVILFVVYRSVLGG